MNINLTILGQIISFVIFVWFCKKYVWPPVVAAMQERADKIAEGLNAADRAKLDLELAQKNATDKMHEAKLEASSIIEAANKRAAQIVDEAKEQARTETERIKEAAQAEIEQDLNRAREQLRGQVAKLAFAGAEKILEASIDENAHKDLVSKMAQGL